MNKDDSSEIIEKLKKIILFSDFEKDQERLLKVYSLMEKEIFRAGEIIIKEGDVGDKLYILNQGTVKVFKKTLNDDDYAVAVLKAEFHIFFGEVALIDSDKRSATVMAQDDCEVLSISQKKYLKLCEDDPLMGYKVTLQIARRLTTSLRKVNTDVITLFEALISEVEGTF